MKRLKVGFFESVVLVVATLLVGCPVDRTVSVPSVVGMAQSAAERTLDHAGLNVGSVSGRYSSQPVGEVLEQDPAAGERVDLGAAVHLVVSSGPAPVLVPAVVGLSFTAAMAEIRNAGLAVDTPTRVYSDRPVDEVLEQSPAAGTGVPPGTAVVMVVSLGKEPVIVPSVEGLQQSVAESMLQDAGLGVGTVNLEFSPSPVGEVLRQNPNAGSAVDPGSNVNLVVSKGPRPTWRVQERGPLVEILYGGAEFHQYAVLDTASGYFRMVPSPQSIWGTSVIGLPSFWLDESQPPVVFFVKDFGEDLVRDVAVCDGRLFVLTQSALYRSVDAGATWTVVSDSMSSMHFRLDVDGSAIYWTDWGTIYKSVDYGETRQTVYTWGWDPIPALDFCNGYGWAIVANWGAVQGAIQFRPDGTRQYLGAPTGRSYQLAAFADPLRPDLAAFLITSDGGRASYYVSDSGETWTILDRSYGLVRHVEALGSDSVRAFTRDYCTVDYGETWSSLPMDAVGFATDVQTSTTYASGDHGDIWKDRYGENRWRRIGTGDLLFSKLAVLNGIVFGVSSDNRLYSVEESELVESYYQGVPESFSYAASVVGETLYVDCKAEILGVQVDLDISFSPPAEGKFDARVWVEAVFPEDFFLAPRFDAFKPVMLSSMRISETLWDCVTAVAGEQLVDVPYEQGLVLEMPVLADSFALVGGTSDWKEHAPTIEIELNQEMEIQGFVTASEDPNDDNIGYWAATPGAIESWAYTVHAVEP